jgi:hypothetical protein
MDFVRTTKSELDLEPPVLHVELVQLSGLQEDIYDALRNRYAGMFDISRQDRTMLAQMGEVTMYLLEAATNPALLAGRTPDQGAIPFRYPSLAVPPGSRLADLIERYHRHEIPLKFKKLAVTVEENAPKDARRLSGLALWACWHSNECSHDTSQLLYTVASRVPMGR